MAVARALDHVAQRGHQLVERLLVGVVNGGRDEAAAADRDGESDVDGVAWLVPVVAPKAVQLRHIAQGAGDGILVNNLRANSYRLKTSRTPAK